MAEGIEIRVAKDGSRTYRASVWSNREGKRIRKSFAREAEAKAWRQDAAGAVRRGALRPSKPITLNQAAAEWLKAAEAGTVRTRAGRAYKAASIRNYERTLRLHVLPALGRRKVADVRKIDVQDLVDGLVAQNLQPVTVQCAILPLRAIYGRLVDRGDLAVNPTSRVNVPKGRRTRDRIRIPSLDDARALLAPLELRDRALYGTALYAGLRLGELQALKWSAVDLATGVIHVEAGWDRIDREEIEPKTEDGRRKVPVAGVLRDLLLEHRMAGTGEGYVFGRTPGEPFAPSSVYKRVRKAWGWEKVDGRWIATPDALEPIKPHDLRHVCASVMIAAGINAKALSTYMGHSSIAITFDLYGHLMPGYMDEAAGMLDAFLARAGGPSPSMHPSDLIARVD
jgi:integrase